MNRAMTRVRSRLVTIVVASGLLTAIAWQNKSHASGFLIYDLSGEAIGRASAMSAGVSDATAVWFNPAQLAFLGGSSASVGGVFVTARSSFAPSATGSAAGSGTTDSLRGNFVLPTVFVHSALSDRVAIGMGAFTAFGIGIDWPSNWVGRENAIGASVQTFTLNPTLAVKIHPRVAIGFGFDAVRAAVDFRTGLPSLIGGDVRLVGETWGYGANGAVHVNAIPDLLQFAVTYRSRVRLAFNGQADFRPDNPEFSRMLHDQGGNATIKLPDIMTAGVMAKPRPDLALGFDVNYVVWSTYSQVNIDFADPTTPDKVLRPAGKDGFTFRTGADWAMPACPGLHLRAGLIYDRSAVPPTGVAPGLPDADRIDVTAGMGYQRGRFKVDLGYMLVHFLDATATGGIESPEGTYSTTANLIGLTLSVVGAPGLGALISP